MKHLEMPKHIVVMMDAFKGSLSSAQAGKAVADSVRRVLPQAKVTTFPVADGGEGTVDAFLAIRGGRRQPITVHGPLTELLDTYYAISTDGETACIEVASICGLPLVPTDRRNPLDTTTRGVGEAIADALNRGCRTIVIGLGGSATNDVGIGALQALGFRFLNSRRKNIRTGCGRLLEEICYVDDANIHPMVRKAKFHLLCDVDNPLFGPYGAVATFAPQKGATSPSDRKKLEYGMLLFHVVTAQYMGITPDYIHYAGAAGGMAYGLRNYLNAIPHKGLPYLIAGSDVIAEQLKQADLIITGEGRADQQTLMGKAPLTILQEGYKRRTPVILVAGSVADKQMLRRAGFRGIFATTPATMPIETAMEPDVAEENIRRTVVQVMQTYCHASSAEETTDNPQSPATTR